MFSLVVMIFVFLTSHMMGSLYLNLIKFETENQLLKHLYALIIGLGIYSLILFILTIVTDFIINPQNFLYFSSLLFILISIYKIRSIDPKTIFKLFRDQLKYFDKSKIKSYLKKLSLVENLEISLIGFIIAFYLLKLYLLPIYGFDAIAIFDYKGFTIYKTNSYDFIDVRIEHGLFLPLFYATFYHFTSTDQLHQFFFLCIFIISLWIIRILYDQHSHKAANSKSLFILFLLSSPFLLNYLFRTYADIVFAFYSSISLILLVNSVLDVKKGFTDKAKQNFKVSITLLVFLPWIKTEGLAYLGIFLLLHAFLLLFFIRVNIPWNWMKYYAIAIPLTLFWPITLKVLFQSSSTYFQQDLISQLTDLNLNDLEFIGGKILFYLFGFTKVASGTLNITSFSINTSLIFYIMVSLLFISAYLINKKKQNNMEMKYYFWVLIFLFIVTFFYLLFIFYTSPYKSDQGLSWVVNTAMAREILHITPAITYLTFKLWDAIIVTININKIS